MFRAGNRRRIRKIFTQLTRSVEVLEPRQLLSFAPYISGGWSATPNYEFVDTKTQALTTAVPLGSTTPGAPLIPATMRQAYGLGSYTQTTSGGIPSWTYNYGISFNGTRGDGTGQTIAIVDAGSDPNIASDLQTFDAYYDLPNPPSFQQLSQTGSTTLPGVNPGWPGEISLDVEWSHVMAPNASVILIAASDLYAGVRYAATIPGVSVVSMSFTIGGNAPDSSFVTPSGHTGVSFFAGNGDTGSEVPSPAQSVNVVAVGGTSLNLTSGGQYSSESVWSAGGGGISGSENQPTYQSGLVSLSSTTQRVTPDISMDANPGTGVAICNSYDSGSAAPWQEIIGGTSLSTPLTAGTIAVVNQGRVVEGLTAMDGGTQLLPRLYELYQANYSANFHDVTTGNNGHPALVGYDMGTGIGTPNGANFINDLAGGDKITGTIFRDNNGNGTYDVGTDTLLTGQQVYLDLGNTGAQTPQDPVATTNSSGQYTFSDVVGSAHGVVHLVGSTGQINENTATFTTAYDATQTYNIAIGSTTTYSATATPTTTTLQSSLSATITGTPGAGLTYTWMTSTKPGGAASPTFSPNGTAAAINSTVTFNMAGIYILAVKVTNSAGQSTTASVSVTVTQVATSVAISSVPAAITAGQLEQLIATQYDQFGNTMNAPVAMTWSVISGGGSVTASGVYTAATGTLATVRASIGSASGTVTVGVVSVPWTASDIGNLGNNGQASQNGSTVTMTEASDDIWNTSDDFLFDYQELNSTNITMIAELNSQVSTSTYIKAGLMIRNSLSASDQMAMISDPAPGADFEWRTTSGALAAQTVGGAQSVPAWLELVRNGSLFTGYISSNGTTWTSIGSQTIAMGNTVYVGLALSSHDATRNATAVFSNINISSGQTLTSVATINSPINMTVGQTQQLLAEGFDQNGFGMSTQPTFTWTQTSGGGTLSSTGLYTASAATLATATATTGSLSSSVTIGVVKSPWTGINIGSVAIPGEAYDSATTTTLTEGSDDIWNQADDFLFDYQTVTGNFTITAELNSQTSASTYIKAGVMVRNTLDPASAMAMETDPAPGPLFEWRTLSGGTAAQDATTAANNPPYWLRLVRNGSTLLGYSSPNGVTWTLTGTQTISMNPTVYIGLALSSHNPADSATAVFSNVTVNDPTVATAAGATPNPVTGTTANLSVLGANTPNASGESTLSYSWAATSVPSGATTPTFSVNNTNAAKNTTATFFRAGTYTFTVTISDAVGDTTTSTVSVVVNQTLTSIALTPAVASLTTSQSQQLAAVARDQFGIAMASQPSFTWNASAGSVTATGNFTAGTSGGLVTVTATSGSIHASASIGVVNSPWTSTEIGAPPITGLAYDSGGTTTVEGSGSDIWNTSDQFHFDYQAISGGATIVAEIATTPILNTDATSTNSAKGGVMFRDSTAAGASFVALVYTNGMGLQLLYRTGTGAAAAQSGSNISVSGPLYLKLVRNGSTFTGYYSPNGTTWTLAASVVDGSVGNPALVGLVTCSHSTTELATVTYSNVQISQSLAFTGTTGADTYAIRLNGSNPSQEQIFVNTPETGTPTYTYPLSQLTNLSFSTASDGTVTIDYTNGNPLPSGGISFTGGSTLTVTGSSAGGMSFTVGANQVINTATSSSPMNYSGVSLVQFNLTGGSNSLTQTAQPSAAVLFNAGAGNNTLTVNGGAFSFSSDPQLTAGNLTVNDNAAVTFAGPVSGSGYNPRNLASLNISSGATASLIASSTATDRTVLELGQLFITGTGKLDVGNNAAIVHGGDLATLSSLITSGLNSAVGYWNGSGIDSSTAAANVLTAVGIISNNNSGSVLYPTFEGQAVVATDVLIKYTYYGDAGLNGSVNSSDYTRIDAGFLSKSTGWSNGDLNYDGVINGSDYTLIDNAFNTQGAVIQTQISPRGRAATESAGAATPTQVRSSGSGESLVVEKKHKQSLYDSLFSDGPDLQVQ